jgi:peptidyl-prolyl cis-trans isomerase C
MEDKILAVVNGREIKDKDINEAIARFPKERQGFLSSDEGRKQLLNQIVSFELIYADSVDNGLENDDEYKEQLEVMKKEMLTQLGIKKVLDTVKISDEEVKAYYDANKSLFKSQGSVSAKHILVASEDKALDVKKEIEAGKTFEAAAKEYSSCPSKEQGGNLGKFTRGQMVPEFEEAAFTQEIGVVGEPVKTQFGYHLIKVEEKTPEEVKDFKEVQASITQRLLQERQNMKYMQYTEELMKKYAVEIK